MTQISGLAVAGLVLPAIMLAACTSGSSGSHVAQLRSTASQSNSPSSAAQTSTQQAGAVGFAQCMRAHGVPTWPDPNSSGRIPDPGSVGVDQGSPLFQAANDTCAQYRPPYIPSNQAYNAYAATARAS